MTFVILPLDEREPDEHLPDERVRNIARAGRSMRPFPVPVIRMGLPEKRRPSIVNRAMNVRHGVFPRDTETVPMKTTKRCPKCESEDIILVPGKREAGGTSNLIGVSRWNMFAAVKPVLHVCALCGYMENWLVSPKDIAKVKARYGRR
jgi:hypothetical protein